MHHPVATHHRQHVNTVLDRSAGHEPGLGKVTTQQDLQVRTPIT
jgi:hypothetical protein